MNLSQRGLKTTSRSHADMRMLGSLAMYQG